MIIVNLDEFLSYPENTVFSKYLPCSFGCLSIKYDNCGSVDFYCNSISDSIKSDSSEEFIDILLNANKLKSTIELDFDSCGRDGLFDANQLFAVWGDEDVIKLITELQKCIKGGK